MAKTDKYTFRPLIQYSVPCLLGFHTKLVHPMANHLRRNHKKWVYCKYCKTEWITWL